MSAGRIPFQNHRGRPKKLGRPPEGILRRLTTNEAILTGITRASLVGDLDGATYLFEVSGKDYKLVRDGFAEMMIEEYWEGEQ